MKEDKQKSYFQFAKIGLIKGSEHSVAPLAVLENIVDAKEDIEENIDIEGQIVCKEMQPKVKLSKLKSSTCHTEKETPTTIIEDEKNITCKKPSYSVNEQYYYSSYNFLNNLNQIIIFHDQDLKRKAFTLNNNLWECELEMKI